MIRFNRHQNKFYFDHSELLSDPGIHAIVGKPRPQPCFRSQRSPAKAAASTTVPIEDPLTKFRRLVEELVLRGVDYATAVEMVDQEYPDLRERSVELARYRSTVAANHRKEKAVAWRVEVQRRFIARRGVR